MEGRRVNSRTQKSNPLFALFLCMIAAVFVLLVVSVVLGLKLSRAEKELKTASAQVTELKQRAEQLESDLAAAQSRTTVPTEPQEADVPAPADNTVPTASWLDLSGHNELAVKPSALLDGYKTYYATAGVNVRSGPGTSYTRLGSVAYGTAVQVAAREKGWSFAKVGNTFGWLSSDYLSATQPPPQPPKRTEATSGSLRTQ